MAVLRLSRGTFDPAHIKEVEAMTRATGEYLVPAIKRLPGLLAYFAAVSEQGSMVHVSIWESDEAANQMASLKEMIVNARADATAAGVTFSPIVNHTIAWDIRP